MGKHAIFYDANCFTTIPIVDLKKSIAEGDNYILSSVSGEVRKGKSIHPEREEFSLVLNSDDTLSKEFNEIKQDNCEKDSRYSFAKSPVMYLKKNPLLCSAYYTWLSSAVNPAIVHDKYRHAYNQIIFQIQSKDENIDDLISLEQKLSVREVRIKDYYDKQNNKNSPISNEWIAKSRKKRLRDFKKRSLILTDYQTVTTSFLFSCVHQQSSIIITSDRDLIDIQDNLYRSIMERYAVNNILTQKVASFTKEELLKYHSEGVDVEIKINDIDKEVSNNLIKIKNEKFILKNYICLYKKDTIKPSYYQVSIPLWLTDFILEYKKNLECFSINGAIEEKYSINYSMHPDFDKNIVRYHLFKRTPLPLKVCWPSCANVCSYPKHELNDPFKMGDFTKVEDLKPSKPHKGYKSQAEYQTEYLAFHLMNEGQAQFALGNIDDANRLYSESAKLKPDLYLIWFYWGMNIMKSVERENPSESIYITCCEKFQKATELKPDMYEAFLYWGIALLRLAEMNNQISHLKDACDKFKSVVEIKEDCYDAWLNWAVSLSLITDHMPEENTYELASSKFERAVNIDQNAFKAWFYWALMLNKYTAFKGNETLYIDAFNKYEKAAELNPNDFDVWYLWGCALIDLAEIKDYNEALYGEAFLKFQRASEIDNGSYTLWERWGEALLNFAEDKKSESLFIEAFQKFEKATKLKSDLPTIYNHWAYGLLYLAQMKANNVDLLNQAIVKAESDNVINPFSSSYIIARAYSLLNETKNALKHLEDFLKHNELNYAREVIEGDNSFLNIRTLHEFKTILDKYSFADSEAEN